MAIGIWLYDTTPQLSKTGTDINKAMLAGFGTSNTSISSTVVNANPNITVDYKGTKIITNNNKEYTNFDWLIK